MAAFPETPTPTWSYIVSPEWRTIITPFDSGREQRRSKWVYSKYNVQLNYIGLQSSNCENIWRFYQARSGAYEAFHFFDPIASTHVAVYVGTGDGATTAYSLPVKELTTASVLINGSTVTPASFSTGGLDGSDIVNFSAAPTSTEIITCSFQGRLRIRCRFQDDNLSRDNFDKLLFNYAITLKGLAPA